MPGGSGTAVAGFAATLLHSWWRDLP